MITQYHTVCHTSWCWQADQQLLDDEWLDTQISFAHDEINDNIIAETDGNNSFTVDAQHDKFVNTEVQIPQDD